MCNPWCQTFVADSLPLWPRQPEVLEVGARDVNGSVRPLCAPLAARYVGVDLAAGPAVDVVADATRLDAVFAPASFDVVLSTEMLEHIADWPAACAGMLRVLRHGGLWIVTTRSPGFPRHDHPGDFWRFTPADVRAILRDAADLLGLADDNTLGYACGIGFVARKRAAVDYPAWQARLAQAVALYSMEACAPLTHAAWVGGANDQVAPAVLRERIHALEQRLFDGQIAMLECRRDSAAALQQAEASRREQATALEQAEASRQEQARALEQAEASRRDLEAQVVQPLRQQLAACREELQQVSQRSLHLELSLAAWRASVFGRLAALADGGWELARLPFRAVRYACNRTLRTKALASVQRRWNFLRHRNRPADLPELAWLLEKLELPVEAAGLIARLGGYLTPGDVARYQAMIGPLRALASGASGPLLRAQTLSPAAEVPATRRRLLFVCGEFPNPVHGGGGRVADFIKLLSERHDVFVGAWYERQRDHDAYVALASYCRQLRGLTFEDLEAGCPDKLLQMLDGQPADIVHYEWPRSLHNFDRRLGRRHIFTHMESVTCSLWLDLRRLPPLTPEWLRRMTVLLNMLSVEVLEARQADMQVVVTAKDGQFLSRFTTGQPFYILNHGINRDEVELPDRPPEPHTLVFTGNFLHYPNAEAVHYFMRAIRPLILPDIPDLRLLFVGAHPAADIRSYHDGRSIIVTGYVPDVRPYIQQAAVCIAPLVSGAGLRTKVVQYSALRRPSVVTPLAVEDLALEPGREIAIAADPRDFAARIVELLRDPARAAAMAAQARTKVLALYDNRRLVEGGLDKLHRLLLNQEGL